MNVRGAAAGLALLGVTLPTVRAIAATQLSAVRYVPDITVVLGGTTISDDDVAVDNLAGSVSLVNVGTIPAQAEIAAYDRLFGGTQLLSFATTITLPGVTVNPGDVTTFDGTTYALLLDAAAANIPSGVLTDAVTAIGPNDLLLSFDVTVDFGSFTADDEDLVRVHDGVFSLFLDGSAAGVPAGLDLDAAHCIQRNGHLLLSFDGSGMVGGVAFDDEDVLELTPSTSIWEMSYDGSAARSGWAAADLIAFEATEKTGGGTLSPSLDSDPASNGLVVGSVRVFGTAAARAKPDDTCILIYEAGPNGMPDTPPGSVDDILLGTGGTDGSGRFVDSADNPGIGLSQPLIIGDRLFAYDQCSDLTSSVRTVPAPVPAASWLHLLALIGLLLTLGGMGVDGCLNPAGRARR